MLQFFAKIAIVLAKNANFTPKFLAKIFIMS
jgi:hypothetical protein